MPEGLPSLDLIATKVTEERRAVAAHADALDAKAGVVLGFAGAIVVIAAPRRGALLELAIVSSAAAALAAMGAFFPRSFPVLRLQSLREKYLRADEPFTSLSLIDTEIELREKDALARPAQVTAPWRVDSASRRSGQLGRDGNYPELRGPMARSHDMPPEDPEALPPPPPFAPDPDLVDHMEDNRWLIRRWREAARRDAASARVRYEEATSSRG